MIHRLIVPMTMAVLAVQGGLALAQGAFPAPLPNQQPRGPVANDSAFPPVNGAAPRACERSGISASQRSGAEGLRRCAAAGASPFPSAGAAPVAAAPTGFSPAPPTQGGGGGRPVAGLHERFPSLARRRREEGQDDQGRERPSRAARRGLQDHRQLRRGRSEDDQIRRDQCRQMRNSGSGRRPVEDRPQEHRSAGEEGLQRRRADEDARGRPARSLSEVLGIGERGARRPRLAQGRQHLRNAERQRPVRGTDRDE